MTDIETCPKCGDGWPYDSEQAAAIRKRGRCICCLIESGEHFIMHPYEFAKTSNTAPAKLAAAMEGKSK